MGSLRELWHPIVLLSPHKTDWIWIKWNLLFQCKHLFHYIFIPLEYLHFCLVSYFVSKVTGAAKLHPATWVKVLLYLFADKIDSWYPTAYITQSLLSTATYIVKYFVKIQDFKNALFIQSRSTFYNV